jgi:two-component system, OmpR family, phosphate regulon response regulator OmpR
MTGPTGRAEPLPDNAPHVLLVDDDQRIRDLLARFLSENGFRVTPAADAASARAAILMLTALDQVEDRVAGLETGADDYMVKPFEPRELLLRLKNILRRGQSRPTTGDEVSMGEFSFHIGRGELKKGDESIKLTERERDLLRQFALRAGTSVARHELAADESTGSERAIDVQINRLRRKIEIDPSNPVYLQTVRGKGYILYTD